MTALVDHLGFEFKTGLRNPSALLLNYLFPLAFYAMMGLVMTKINPRFAQDPHPGDGHLRGHVQRGAGPARSAGRAA